MTQEIEATPMSTSQLEISPDNSIDYSTDQYTDISLNNSTCNSFNLSTDTSLDTLADSSLNNSTNSPVNNSDDNSLNVPINISTDNTKINSPCNCLNDIFNSSTKNMHCNSSGNSTKTTRMRCDASIQTDFVIVKQPVIKKSKSTQSKKIANKGKTKYTQTNYAMFQQHVSTETDSQGLLILFSVFQEVSNGSVQNTGARNFFFSD